MTRANEQTAGESTGEELRGSAQQVQKNLRDIGEQVRDAATERYQHLRDQASEYYEQGRERAMEWERGLEEYVQEKPIKSLLIAAGVGLLIGLIWKRS